MPGGRAILRTASCPSAVTASATYAALPPSSAVPQVTAQSASRLETSSGSPASQRCPASPSAATAALTRSGRRLDGMPAQSAPATPMTVTGSAAGRRPVIRQVQEPP